MVEKLNRKLTMIALALGAALISLLVLDFRLGLDLKGGTRLVYSVDLKEARAQQLVGEGQTDGEVLAELQGIWLERIDPTGTKGVAIRRVGTNRVVIEIPASASAATPDVQSSIADDVAADAATLVLVQTDVVNWDQFPRTGGRIKIGDETLSYASRSDNVLQNLSRGLDRSTQSAHAAGTPVVLEASDPWQAIIENTGRMEVFAEPGASAFGGLTDITEQNRLVQEWIDANPGLPLSDYNLKLQTENAGRALGQLRYFYHRNERERGPEPVLLGATPEEHFTGTDFAAVRQAQDQSGFPAVGFDIAANRQKDFGNYTGNLFDNSLRMAVVINDEIVTYPTMNAKLSSGGIIEGGMGGFSIEEVQDLVKVLRSGSLRVSPTFESQEVVGATLGQEYVRLGTLSAVTGLIVVVIFIITYYRLLGLFTVLSLAFNLTVLMGAMALMQTTLTLPGVAGIILTVGMAVDANILIFERLREELLKGRRTIQAAKDGFNNALSTILDANITTLITGLILFSVGSGPVRGFAATLCIGIITSVFSALVVTRVLMHFSFERGTEDFKMMRLVRDTSIGFMGASKKFIPVSLVLIVAGVGIFSALPANEKLGIDFVGGSTTTITLENAMTKDAVRERVTAIGDDFKDATVQEIANSAEGDGYTRYRVEFKATGEEEAQDSGTYKVRLETALKDILSRGPIEVANEGGAYTGTLFFEQAHTDADVKAHLDTLGWSELTVTAVAGSGDRSFAFNATGAATAEAGTLYRAIEDAFTKKVNDEGIEYSWQRPIPSVDAVGPQVVQELRDKAILAILFSLFAIVMYIRVRFAEYSFGIAAVAALVHDVLITLGVIAIVVHFDIVEAEISLTMIAAFLTIIGYSLNDTIVVFDRIRENLPKYKRPLREVIDTSINQTLARTLLTSATTLLAVMCLFFFNFGTRNALEGFGFALIIGVLIGTYSSMFIASPVLLFLENRRIKKGGAPIGVATTEVEPTPESV